MARLIWRCTGDSRICDDSVAHACGDITRAPHAFNNVDDDFARMHRNFRAANTGIVLGRAEISAPVVHFHTPSAFMRQRLHH